MRKSTAIWSQGTPSTNASQHPWATAAASASSSAYARTVGAAAVGAHRVHGRPFDAGRAAEHAFRDVDDLRARSVVAVERHDRAAREVAREVGERRRVGARERVDRLRRVADHAEVGAIPEPGPQEADLQRGRVLELVDEHVPEPPALRGCERRVALDRVGAPAEQVVEVATPALALLGFVAGVEVGDLGRGHRRVPARPRRPRPRSAPGDRPRALAHSISAARSATSAVRPGPVAPTSGAEQPRLRGQDRGCVPALFVRAPPELGERERVEGAGGDPFDLERSEPVDQLTCGFARERDREHVARLGVAVARAPRDATGEHARLARTGRREDRERFGRCRDRLALARVESVEEKIHAAATVAKRCATRREAAAAAAK